VQTLVQRLQGENRVMQRGKRVLKQDESKRQTCCCLQDKPRPHTMTAPSCYARQVTVRVHTLHSSSEGTCSATAVQGYAVVVVGILIVGYTPHIHE
jgi:hypothetical protein